jgi:putative endonuclease
VAVYSVYILYSKRSDIYYVGHTENVNKRLLEHNDFQSASFTSKHQPWVLKSSFVAGNDRGIAMKIERFIKKQKSKAFIEKVISNPMDINFIAQLVRVPRPRD